MKKVTKLKYEMLRIMKETIMYYSAIKRCPIAVMAGVCDYKHLLLFPDLPSALCQTTVASSCGSWSLLVSLVFTYLESFLVFTHQCFNPDFLLFQCDQTIPVDQLLNHSPPSHPHLCHPLQPLLPEPKIMSLHLLHPGSHLPALELTVSSY